MRVNPVFIKSMAQSVDSCFLCQGIDTLGALLVNQKETCLKYNIYPEEIPIRTLFVGISPPKEGFFGDLTSQNTRFREAIFNLLNESGLGPVTDLYEFSQKGYYLADAICCRWNGKIKKNIPKVIRKNCSQHLAEVIDLFRPKSIVTMGGIPKESLGYPVVSMQIRELWISNKNIITTHCPVVAPIPKAESIKKLRQLISG